MYFMYTCIPCLNYYSFVEIPIIHQKRIHNWKNINIKPSDSSPVPTRDMENARHSAFMLFLCYMTKCTTCCNHSSEKMPVRNSRRKTPKLVHQQDSPTPLCRWTWTNTFQKFLLVQITSIISSSISDLITLENIQDYKWSLKYLVQ